MERTHKIDSSVYSNARKQSKPQAFEHHLIAVKLAIWIQEVTQELKFQNYTIVYHVFR